MNTFRVSTPNAQSCGLGRSREIALQTAAVQVLRQGGDRFIVVDETSETNLSGVTINRDFDEVFTGVGVQMRTDQGMLVRILKQGDAGFTNGMSARTVLGSDWQTAVAEGASTSCF